MTNGVGRTVGFVQLHGKGALPVHLAERAVVGTGLSVIQICVALRWGIRSEKRVVRLFRRCANLIECT